MTLAGPGLSIILAKRGRLSCINFYFMCHLRSLFFLTVHHKDSSMAAGKLAFALCVVFLLYVSLPGVPGKDHNTGSKARLELKTNRIQCSVRNQSLFL